ncbi:MAG: hydrogenase-1 expression HyaE [Gammaproteobacteria bacterium]
MISPLIERLIRDLAYPQLTAENLEAVTGRGTWMLFFTGDPKAVPESNDVAVVLPELVRAFPGRFSVAVVAREAETDLQRRYGFQRWPTLVLLRDGQYLGALSGMQDWDVYQREIARLLDGTPRRAPTIGIPVVGNDRGACGSRL